jgi:N-acetylneuraminic acid mutarotase
MLRPICHHGAEIVNDNVYIIGGRTTGYAKDATDSVLMFDPSTNACTRLKNLPYPVFGMATVTWKDNVVVLGGADKGRKVLDKAILYNVTTGSHWMLPEMTKNRRDCTAAIIGDNIITMGGWDRTHNGLASVECYNFEANTWTKFPAMAKARFYPTAVVKYC